MSGWLCFNVTKVHPVDLQKKDQKKKRQQQRLLIRLILGPDLLLKWQRKPGMFKCFIWCMSYKSFNLCVIFNGSIDTDLFFLQMLFSVL